MPTTRIPKPIYDKKGREIQFLDLIQIYHFTGARRKKHYMYKQVRLRDGFLIGNHLDGTDEWFDLQSLADENGVLKDVLILQSPLRLKAQDYSI